MKFNRLAISMWLCLDSFTKINRWKKIIIQTHFRNWELNNKVYENIILFLNWIIFKSKTKIQFNNLRISKKQLINLKKKYLKYSVFNLSQGWIFNHISRLFLFNKILNKISNLVTNYFIKKLL